MAGESILVIGNCQADVLGNCLRMMLDGATITLANRRAMRNGETDITPLLAGADRVFLQTPGYRLADVMQGNPQARVTTFPAITFTGFQPDIVYARHRGDNVRAAMGGNNSAIALFAWMKGISLEKTLSLFRSDVFDALGYHDHMQASIDALVQGGDVCGLDLRAAVARLVRGGCFMHTTLHPKLPLMAEIARALIDKVGITPAVRYPEHYMSDELLSGAVWPVYPEIGARLGIGGEYIFKCPKVARFTGKASDVLSLAEFVRQSFAAYAEKLAPDEISCARFESESFRQLTRFFSDAPIQANPYRDLPDQNFWRKSVSAIAPTEIDPVVAPRFTISDGDRIATAGSCFAQHIARRLAADGHHYLVAEAGEHLPEDRRTAAQYGVYSARYGNIYTARQLVQLFRRAYGSFVPQDRAWTRDDKLVDPFRPEVEPGGFADIDALIADRERHFVAVRQMFEQLDVFVFTLGLTEAWRARADGAMFPVAPGVVAPVDPEAYEFVNFSAGAVKADLEEFIALLAGVNPRARILLTLSPVPLIATYERRHVLVSTVASKAALRTAADEICREHRHVDYFPSYEIITATDNRYFEADLRTVAAKGVDHVMRVFTRHYATPAQMTASTASVAAAALAKEFADSREIICEEDLLDR